MKLLRSTKSKITKDENGESVPRLEINDVALVHCNIVNNNSQQNAKVPIKVHLFLINFLVNC